jgi:hypothetical protein
MTAGRKPHLYTCADACAKCSSQRRRVLISCVCVLMIMSLIEIHIDLAQRHPATS